MKETAELEATRPAVDGVQQSGKHDLLRNFLSAKREQPGIIDDVEILKLGLVVVFAGG